MVYAMSKINFYNGDRTLIMSFSDFIFQKFDNSISFQINVRNNFVQASVETESLEDDFTDFLAKLHDLYEMRVNKISFLQSIENNIQVDFNLNEIGGILVSVRIDDYINFTTLQFEYGTDQSFLPELIEEIETTLEELR
ncbi:MAG: hypothetical protein J6Y11_00475 [Paludibacteraceae bacterium]|nr:hypothetical protein [Paludibacteraceae bacterium]